jgi:hypothetical protein
MTASRSEIGGESRREFIAAQKATNRSILVNVDVLTEGYDDPSVNTIVMARPTSSKLVYMQALGRAVRIDPNNQEKEAYVVEVVDELPNIRYRIDNRWLYSDISDLLEPDVLDVFYDSPETLRARLRETFDRFGVLPAHREIPELSPKDRVTLLLFKTYAGGGKVTHIPLLITNDTRRSAAGFFNFLAARMRNAHGLDVEQVFRPVLAHATRFRLLCQEAVRRHVFQAMENAWELVRPEGGVVSRAIDENRPWITFVAFRFETTADALGADLLHFTNDMLNKDSICAALRTASIGEEFFLVKFPLPLRGTWGVFLPPSEFSGLQAAIERLQAHSAETDGVGQWRATVAVLGTAAIAVEQRHVQSLATIVREGMDYFRPLAQASKRKSQ